MTSNTGSGSKQGTPDQSLATTQPVKGAPPAVQKKGTAKPEYTGGLELVMYRNNFYRDNYRKLMLVCLGLIAIIAGLLYWAFYERSHKPAPQYFATTYDGKLIALKPLSDPNISDNALLQWATEAAVSAYTFNYVNYRKALQDSRIYFTQTGYQYFLKALKDSRNLDAVQERKFIVTATPTGAPTITKKGLYPPNTPNATYIWMIQLPMMLKFINPTEQLTQNILLNMTISRVSTLESPQGVGIASFVMSEARGQ